MIDVFPVEIDVAGGLVVALRPRGGDWLASDLAALRRAGFDVLVSTLTADEERELDLGDEEPQAIANGLQFIRIPIEDRGVPTVRESLGVLSRLANDVRNGARVAVHCRQGIGRSTLVAAAVLVLLGREADDAWRAVAAARGRPVPDTDAQREWIAELQRDAIRHPAASATAGNIERARAWLESARTKTSRPDQSVALFGIRASHRSQSALQAQRSEDALAWGRLAVEAYVHSRGEHTATAGGVAYEAQDVRVRLIEAFGPRAGDFALDLEHIWAPPRMLAGTARPDELKRRATEARAALAAGRGDSVLDELRTLRQLKNALRHAEELAKKGFAVPDDIAALLEIRSSLP